MFPNPTPRLLVRSTCQILLAGLMAIAVAAVAPAPTAAAADTSVSIDAASTTHGIVPNASDSLGASGATRCPADSTPFFGPNWGALPTSGSTTLAADLAGIPVTVDVSVHADGSFDIRATGGQIRLVNVAGPSGYAAFGYTPAVAGDTRLHAASVAADALSYGAATHVELCLAAESVAAPSTSDAASSTTTTVPSTTSSTTTTTTTTAPSTASSTTTTTAPSGATTQTQMAAAPVLDADDAGDGSLVDPAGLWLAGLKPSGTALLRLRRPDGTWTSWAQQGGADIWASASVTNDRSGGSWVLGLTKSGGARLRHKSPGEDVVAGWSGWAELGSGGWVTASITVDSSGNVWFIGVKASGEAYARVKNADPNPAVGWSAWTAQGKNQWRSISIAVDRFDNLWLAGITVNGSSFVRTRQAAASETTTSEATSATPDRGAGLSESLDAGWSHWLRMGGSADWTSLDITADSTGMVWVVGVKGAGTAYLRAKTVDPSIRTGWSDFLQLGSTNSWSSMTTTVDGSDTLWLAGVKHSGTAFVRMRCLCGNIVDGWSAWQQQGAVNSWSSLGVVADPEHRVTIVGTKLTGVALSRTKGTTPGVETGWGAWEQHGGSGWATMRPHSDRWTGVHAGRAPSLAVSDVHGKTPPGHTTRTTTSDPSPVYC